VFVVRRETGRVKGSGFRIKMVKGSGVKVRLGLGFRAKGFRVQG